MNTKRSFIESVCEWKSHNKQKLRILIPGEKICSTCIREFKKLVRHEVKGSLMKKYYDHFGYPEKWIHTTKYVTCDGCREKSKKRSTRKKIEYCCPWKIFDRSSEYVKGDRWRNIHQKENNEHQKIVDSQVGSLCGTSKTRPKTNTHRNTEDI